MEQLINLRRCANSFEAQLIKGRLEAEGIPAMVADENIGALYAGAVTAFNPRILVNAADEERARAVLAEFGDE